jgi:hypothetical protein
LDVSVAFNELGEITVLSIDGDYFDRFKLFEDNLKHKIFGDKSFTVDMFGAGYLYISGSSVDEEVFDNLLANDRLVGTSKLRICRTPLTVASLEKLVSIKNIVELYIESETLSFSDLQGFKLQRPDCFVEYNRSEVTL